MWKQWRSSWGFCTLPWGNLTPPSLGWSSLVLSESVGRHSEGDFIPLLTPESNLQWSVFPILNCCCYDYSELPWKVEKEASLPRLLTAQQRFNEIAIPHRSLLKPKQSDKRSQFPTNSNMACWQRLFAGYIGNCQCVSPFWGGHSNFTLNVK